MGVKLITEVKMNLNKRGFSLIELMIVMGVIGGLSLIVMNLTKQSTKSSSKFQFDSDVTLTTNEINGILSDPAKCLATLATNANPTNINGKYYTKSSGSAPVQGYGNSGLEIASYVLTTSGNDGVLTINYNNKNILKGSSGPSSISKRINLYVVGTPGAITKCRSLSTASTDIWSRGAGSDIFYNGGKVGIGTSTPVATLDVSGGVKMANDTAPCLASNEGTQRYNSTSKTMEFCNGSAWTAMGGGSVPSGTVCGFSGRVFNLVTNQWGNFSSLCQGVDPLTSCPSGYTRNLSYAYGNAHFNAVWCTKN